MDKNKLMQNFSTAEQQYISCLYDKLYVSERTSRTVFTKEFYPPNIWRKFMNLSDNFDTEIYTYGIFHESERKVIAFSKTEPEEYPISMIKIKNKSKFNKLSHKDYLGAVMSLGIIREKYGDLIVEDDCCYIAVLNDIVDFLKINLDTIGNCPCEVDDFDYELNEIPQVKFESSVVISTSLRIDCIVSALTGISRKSSNDLISKGKVLIDYIETFEKNKVLRENSIITIRGYGKYIIINNLGLTSRGRIKLMIKKYI
ncbi:MAG: YlmH/Sll1252 family protein [Bacillota bacterium]|nr:YlmH/Sll1252 family protein [Bacillota bacterium]